MSFRLTALFVLFAVPALPLVAQEDPKSEGAEVRYNGIPADLMDDEHVREELAVNEFTAPSISKLFDTLQFLMPLPVMETERKMPARMPMDRADLAIELGFLIADGFLVVQAEQLEKVEELAKDLTRYGKALGAGDRVNRHAASLLDSAKNKDVAQLKKELAATQRDVEVELVTLRDADLAHLISLGGWIRALIEPRPARSWSPSPGLQCPVIFTEGTAGALLHELVGHLVEGDLIASGRSPLAGLGGANLTEAAIDLIDDPRRSDLPGAFDCDDEGVPAKPIMLLRGGQLCGLLCDRETAEACDVNPGRGRRADWRSPPVPRLSNLVVPAGEVDPQSIEADVTHGLVVTRLSGAIVDPISSRTVLRVERGFEIRNGRRRRPLAPFELTGGVTEILAAIDPAVGNDPTPDWRLGWCVKDGHPLPTGSEAPTLMVRRLEVL